MAINGNTLFHSRISPWDVTPGQSQGSAVNHEPLQIALENGAIRAMVPISNEVQFAALPEPDRREADVIFYGDLDRAVLKAIEL